jgi:hypothetical protein
MAVADYLWRLLNWAKTQRRSGQLRSVLHFLARPKLGLHPGGIEASRSIADSVAREGDNSPALTHGRPYRGFG